MQKTALEGINSTLTDRCRADSKYQFFLNWLLDNGAKIHPSLQYPVAFGPRGCIGVATSQDIDSYESVIAIPKKLIIDINKVLETEELVEIIPKFPLLFGQKDQEDNNFNLIALYLIYERAKGKDSFFKFYFDAADCQNLILHWTSEDLEQLQNKEITQYIKRYQLEMDAQGRLFLDLIRKTPSLFPQEIPVEKYLEYFQWSFEFIMTRAFGWSIPESYLIPFADMLNHGQNSIDHCIVDVTKEMSTIPFKGYVRKQTKCNLQILGNPILSERSKVASRLKKERVSKRMKYINSHKQYIDEEVSEENSKQMVYRIAHRQYRERRKRFRQLVFDSSSCTEDNDTQNSDILCKEYNKQIIKIEDKQILRTRSRSLEYSLESYWTAYSNSQYVPIINTHRSSTQSKEDMTVEMSSASEKDFETESDRSAEDSYKWINESDPSNVMFVLYTREKYKKGEQLFNFYGKRPNKFFLVGYNFALLDNKYDSYGLHLYFQNKSMEPTEYNFNITQYLEPRQDVVAETTEVRLKRNRVSLELINHSRAMILSKFSNKNNIYGIPVTIPVDKSIEARALNYAKDIVKHKLSCFKTSIEYDSDLLQNPEISNRLQTALILRLSYKIILTKQLEHLDYCLHILHGWEKGRVDFSLQEMEKIACIKEYMCILDRSTL